MMQNTVLQKLTACALMIGVLSLFSVQAPHVTGQSDKNSQSSDSKPAIKVGSATISKSEFNERVDRRVQRRKMRQKMMQQKMKKKGKKGGKTPELPEIDRKKIKDQVKEQTIKQLILEHHANKADIEVTESEIEEEWQSLVDRFGSEEKLTSRLKKQGKNKEDLMSDLKDYLKMKKFIEKNTEDSEVTDQEVRDFYDKNKKKMGNKSFDDMKEQIRSMLEQRKLQEARSGLVEDLREKTDVEVNI